MSAGAGTGTPAGTPADVSAGDLIEAARVALGDADAAEFSDDELLTFLNEAIREYSQHLPRGGTVILAAVAGETAYPLPWDTTAVVEVAVGGAGGGAGRRLERRGRRSSRFMGGGAYDVIWTGDAGQAPTLSLGAAPEPGATLTVRYRRPHDSRLTLGDPLTVPDEHHHVLVQYILFAAARQQQAREQAAPTNGSALLMAQLVVNTRRLELAWINALNRILTQRLGEGEAVAWDYPY